MGNLGNNLSSIFFSYFDDFFSLTVQVKRYYTSYLHLRLFFWESLISFHFLNFVFISHAIRHQYKRHVLFPKGELFVLFNFCIFIASVLSFIFHEWNWLNYFTKQKNWRSWYLIYWSNAYVIEWNRKIFCLSIFLIFSTIVVIWTQMIHLWLVWKKKWKRNVALRYL